MKFCALQLDLSCSKCVPVAIGLLLASLLLIVGYLAHYKNDRGPPYYLSLLIAASGVGVGMLAGSFASPVETTEGATFKLIAGLIATFLTGFLLKNFQDEIFTKLKASLKGGLPSVRFFMFVVAFLGGALTTYVYRVYYDELPRSKKEIVEKATRDLSRISIELNDLARKPEGK